MAKQNGEKRISDLELLRSRINFLSNTIPNSEKIVAEYFSGNLFQMCDMGLKDVSEKAHINGPAIIRFCKRLGFAGYIDFREYLRSVVQESMDDEADVTSKPSIQEIMQEVVRKNIETLKNTELLFSDEYLSVAQALKDANVIVMFGNGDAVMPCEIMKIKLMRIGKACMAYSDSDLQLASALTINSGDVALAVSHTGRSRSVVEAMRIAHERGAMTVAITNAANSPLVKFCDHVLYLKTIDNTGTGDIISRRIGEQLILETLFMYVSTCSDIDVTSIRKEAMSKIHSMYH